MKICDCEPVLRWGAGRQCLPAVVGWLALAACWTLGCSAADPALLSVRTLWIDADLSGRTWTTSEPVRVKGGDGGQVRVVVSAAVDLGDGSGGTFHGSADNPTLRIGDGETNFVSIGEWGSIGQGSVVEVTGTDVTIRCQMAFCPSEVRWRVPSTVQSPPRLTIIAGQCLAVYPEAASPEGGAKECFHEIKLVYDVQRQGEGVAHSTPGGHLTFLCPHEIGEVFGRVTVGGAKGAFGGDGGSAGRIEIQAPNALVEMEMAATGGDGADAEDGGIGGTGGKGGQMYVSGWSVAEPTRTVEACGGAGGRGHPAGDGGAGGAIRVLGVHGLETWHEHQPKVSGGPGGNGRDGAWRWSADEPEGERGGAGGNGGNGGCVKNGALPVVWGSGGRGGDGGRGGRGFSCPAADPDGVGGQGGDGGVGGNAGSPGDAPDCTSRGGDGGNGEAGGYGSVRGGDGGAGGNGGAGGGEPTRCPGGFGGNGGGGGGAAVGGEGGRGGDGGVGIDGGPGAEHGRGGRGGLAGEVRAEPGKDATPDDPDPVNRSTPTFFEPAAESLPDRWTVMFYLGTDGDESVSRSASQFFVSILEKAQGATQAGVNLYVGLDRGARFGGVKIPTGAVWGAWKGFRKGLVLHGVSPHPASVLTGEWEALLGHNTGDPAQLASFIDVAATHYPAEHYALLLFGHGMGGYHVLPDGAEGGDGLTVPELGNALREAAQKGHPIEVLGMLGCSGKTAELASELSGSVPWLVAAQDASHFDYSYEQWLASLIANPQKCAAELAESIVAESDLESISWTQTADVPPLVQAIRRFVDTADLATGEEATAERNTLYQIWDACSDVKVRQALLFPLTTVVELVDFLDAVAATDLPCRTELRQAAAEAARIARSLSRLKPNQDTFHGFNVFLHPRAIGPSGEDDFELRQTRFWRDTGWERLVQILDSAMPWSDRVLLLARDVLSSIFAPYRIPVSMGNEVAVHARLETAQDADWLSFTLDEESPVRIRLSGSYLQPDETVSVDVLGPGIATRQYSVNTGTPGFEDVFEWLPAGTYRIGIRRAYSGTSTVKPQYTLSLLLADPATQAPGVAVVGDAAPLEVRERGALVLMNTGHAPLTLRSLAFENAAVTNIDLACLVGFPLTIPIAGAVKLSFAVAPLPVGTFTNRLAIETDDPANPVLQINVRGVAGPGFAPGQTRFRADGGFDCGALVEVGIGYVLEGSTDLVRWDAVTSFVASRALQPLSVPAAPGLARRFFRLREAAGQ